MTVYCYRQPLSSSTPAPLCRPVDRPRTTSPTNAVLVNKPSYENVRAVSVARTQDAPWTKAVAAVHSPTKRGAVKSREYMLETKTKERFNATLVTFTYSLY